MKSIEQVLILLFIFGRKLLLKLLLFYFVLTVLALLVLLSQMTRVSYFAQMQIEDLSSNDGIY